MKRNECSITTNLCNISIALIFFVTITLLVIYVPQTTAVDKDILFTVHSWLSAYPTSVAIFISEFGMAKYFLWPLIAASSVLISHKKYVPAILLILFMQLAHHTIHFIKNFICRTRPTEYLNHSYCFPSNHVFGTMCFYGILIFLVHRYVSSKSWKYCLTVLFGGWILAVCISRMWLLAHYPADVFAGLLGGFIFVNLYAIIIKWLNA